MLKNIRWKYAIVTLTISGVLVIYQNCSKNTSSEANQQLYQSNSTFKIVSQFCGTPESAVADSKGNIFVLGHGDPQPRANLFQACNPKYILRKSNDGGNTWKDIDFPMGQSSELIVDANDNLYVLAGPSIMKSTDSGETWNGSGNIIYNGAQIYGTNLALATNGDLYVSGQYTAYQYYSGSVGYGYSYNAQGIFKRANGNSAWELIDTVYGTIFNITLDSAGNVYWAGCDNSNGGQCLVRKSANNGNSWSDLWKGNYDPSGGLAFDRKGNTFIALNYLQTSTNKINGVLVLPANTSITTNSEARIKFLKIGSDDSLNVISATSTEWVLQRTINLSSLTEVGRFTGSLVAGDVDSAGNIFVFDYLDGSNGREWITRVLGK